jgi:DNA-binding MarR family transcriptional regulator
VTQAPARDARWLDAEEQRMWRSYHRMRRALDRGLERQLADESGISGADFDVLVPVSEAPQRQLRARELVRMLNWDRSRLSHHLRRMEQRNLIERLECPSDARGTIIALTPAGWELIQSAAPAHVATVRRLVFDVLSPADVAVFTELAERIADRVANTAADHPTTCDTP